MGNPAVVMYTNSRCSWCARARRLFAAKGLPFTDIDVETVPGGREEMCLRSGRDTVPQIFIGEQYVGGYDEAHALELSGELDALLAATV